MRVCKGSEENEIERKFCPMNRGNPSVAFEARWNFGGTRSQNVVNLISMKYLVDNHLFLPLTV